MRESVRQLGVQLRNWPVWYRVAVRGRYSVTHREFTLLGGAFTVAIMGCGVLLLQMTSGRQVDTQYLRKMPTRQQEMQRQSIEKMREDAKNRTSSENIQAALDAMEKFYGFDQSQKTQARPETLPPLPSGGWRENFATVLSKLGARA